MRALRHFQTVWFSRQDRLDNVEEHEIGDATPCRLRQNALKAPIWWREADGIHRHAILQRRAGEQSAVLFDHGLLALRLDSKFYDILEIVGRNLRTGCQLALSVAVQLEFGSRVQNFCPWHT